MALRQHRVRIRLAAGIIGLAVVAAACGSDKAATSATTASAPATTAKAATTTAAAAASAKDIVTVATEAGTFKTLAAALQAGGLVDTLKGPGPFTVFAPTDDAFAKLPAGTVEGLLKDVPALQNVLKYHVVSGAVSADQVTKLTKADTVAGKPVTIELKDGKVLLNGKVQVIKTDIKASNGVIHVIDAVLLPG